MASGAQTTKSVTTLAVGEEGSAFAIPVSLKKIRTQSDVSLDTASPDGHPIKTQKVDLVTDALVENDEVQSGVFRSKPKKTDKTTWDDFAPISKDDLATIADATDIETFVIDRFIPLATVPFERITDAYFLAPASGMSSKPLVLLAAALKKKKAAGVFKMVKSSRQHLAVVYEKNGGLIVNTLAFANDFAAVREAGDALARDEVKIDRAVREAAEQLIDMFMEPDGSSLDEYEDDLIPLRADLVERAIQGKTLPKKKQRKEEVVVDDGLEARLRESIARVKASPPRTKVAA